MSDWKSTIPLSMDWKSTITGFLSVNQPSLDFNYTWILGLEINHHWIYNWKSTIPGFLVGNEPPLDV